MMSVKAILLSTVSSKLKLIQIVKKKKLNPSLSEIPVKNRGPRTKLWGTPLITTATIKVPEGFYFCEWATNAHNLPACDDSCGITLES